MTDRLRDQILQKKDGPKMVTVRVNKWEGRAGSTPALGTILNLIVSNHLAAVSKFGLF